MCDLYGADEMIELAVAGGDEGRRAVRHALGCGGCRRALEKGAGWAPPPRPADPEAAVEEALERVRTIDDLRRRGRRQAEEWLARHPEANANRLWHLRNRESWRTAGMVAALVEQAARLRRSDPKGCYAFAALATELAEDAGGEDLWARAWAELGNAQRIFERLDAASEAFFVAERYRAQGSGSERLHAELLSLRASLLIDQGQFEHAQELLRQAAKVAPPEPEHRLKLQLKRGLARFHAGDLEAARRELGAILRVTLDTTVHAEVAVAVVHNALWCLGEIALTEPREEVRRPLIETTLAHLHSVRPLYQELPARLLDLDWLQGRLRVGLGELEAAEVELRRVLRRKLEGDQELDAAIVTLDLTAVCLARDDLAAVRELAEGSLRVFANAGLDPEFWAALQVLRHVRERETAERLLAEMAAKLHLGGAPFSGPVTRKMQRPA